MVVARQSSPATQTRNTIRRRNTPPTKAHLSSPMSHDRGTLHQSTAATRSCQEIVKRLRKPRHAGSESRSLTPLFGNLLDSSALGTTIAPASASAASRTPNDDATTQAGRQAQTTALQGRESSRKQTVYFAPFPDPFAILSRASRFENLVEKTNFIRIAGRKARKLCRLLFSCLSCF
jgi:hypothetical protein